MMMRTRPNLICFLERLRVEGSNKRICNHKDARIPTTKPSMMTSIDNDNNKTRIMTKSRLNRTKIPKHNEVKSETLYVFVITLVCYQRV